MTALGLIETKGLIGAIESADAMLKAADVRLLEKNIVGAGLVTITIAGEVSAVKASIEAASAAVERISGAALISEHVIPRPGTGLDEIIATKIVSCDEKPEEVTEPEACEAVKKQPSNENESLNIDKVEELKEAEAQPETESKEVVDDEDPETDEEAYGIETQVEKTESREKARPSEKAEALRFKSSQLKKMNVGRLRDIARSMENLSLQGKDIKSARKKELIEAIMNAYRKEEE